MLVDEERQEMRVPVKALLNPYNGRNAFCAGMPQFFGGTDDDDQPPPAVLENEITQESRRTLELTSDSPPHFFDSGNMSFYWAEEGRWTETGTAWGPGQGPEEQEMDRIVTVDLTQFENALIAELIRQTGSQGAPQHGKDDFDRSVTREAFIALLRMLL
ncbi:MAG TPA: hypothetical protein VJS15_06175 [Allosphingosinicella sp.]|nr:hypothetical protein [Allosphingosinicella sp.]